MSLLAPRVPGRGNIRARKFDSGMVPAKGKICTSGARGAIVPPPLLREALPFFARGTSHLLEKLCEATREPTIDEAVHKGLLMVEASPLLDSSRKWKAIGADVDDHQSPTSTSLLLLAASGHVRVWTPVVWFTGGKDPPLNELEL